MKKLSTQEKWMIALVVVLIIGIIVRWSWISGEVRESWKERFENLGK